VPCAGIGARAGEGAPKQYRPIAGRPMVAWTLEALHRVGRVERTLVVLAPGDARFERHVPAFEDHGGWISLRGGATRAQTVANGLDELAARGVHAHDWVLVHDAARCLLRPEWVDRLLDACIDDAVGGILALPVADTLKHERDGRVAATLERTGCWAAQTPQMFRLGALRDALAHAGAYVTDESSALESLGYSPRLVPGDLANFKVTWPSDFELAAQLLAP
jgi:2-C-methyl-D-erythritol 4-phosphate cytidylyltransferase